MTAQKRWASAAARSSALGFAIAILVFFNSAALANVAGPLAVAPKAIISPVVGHNAIYVFALP